MTRYLSEIGKPVWIRHVLVPERNDYDEDLEELNEFIKSLKNVQRVEVLPYHTPVSYTHLDVYKRQQLCRSCHYTDSATNTAGDLQGLRIFRTYKAY